MSALVLMLLTLAGGARAATFGDDNRRPLSQSRSRLADSIGIITSEDGKHLCTAVCLSPSVIVSAGHCLVRDVPLTFRVGRPDMPRSAALAARGPGTGAVPDQLLLGTRELKLKAPINASEDWAIARLTAPVCEWHGLPVSPLMPTQIREAALDGRVSLVAFHRDVSLTRLSVEAGCEISETFPDRGATVAALARDFSDRDGLLLHRCGTGLGASGAPLLIDTVAGYEIAGINVGTYHISRVELSDGAIVKRLGSEPVANTGVAARVVADALARFPGAETLRPGEELIELQQRLTGLKIYGGLQDGRPSLGLRLVIIAYERMHDMPETGLATQALLKQLRAEREGAQ